MVLPHPTPDRTNGLLERLPPAARRKLLVRCENAHYEVGDVLSEEGAALDFALFPVDCVISQLSPGSNPGVEVALVGHEAMFGTGAAFGTASMLKCTVQHPGRGLRIHAGDLADLFCRDDDVRVMVGKCLAFQGTQMARAAYCNRFHQIGERLARWLLMMSDRARSPRFRATHSFLAVMLGARRAGVTVAASELSIAKLIRYRRGVVEVLDRAGLERRACDCYRYAGRAYALLFD